jgi:hypothetical protein
MFGPFFFTNKFTSLLANFYDFFSGILFRFFIILPDFHFQFVTYYVFRSFRNYLRVVKLVPLSLFCQNFTHHDITKVPRYKLSSCCLFNKENILVSFIVFLWWKFFYFLLKKIVYNFDVEITVFSYFFIV